MKILSLACFVLFPLLLSANPALAHVGHDTVFSFSAGFTHPLHGLDHLLAMLAVGLWAALQGGKALWVLPLSFILSMAVFGILGIAGPEIPALELGITASVILLGLAVALMPRTHLAAAAAVVALFGMFHGYIHGTETPADAHGLSHIAGSLGASALLHATGIGLTLAALQMKTELPVRAAGGAITCSGLFLLLAA